MSIKTTLPISEARRKIFDIAEEVQNPDTYYVLTEKGRPKAVMLSAEEYESLVETLEVMWVFPNLGEDIKEAEESYSTGEYKKWTTLDELLAKEGYVLKEKAKKGYEVRRQAKTERGKITGKTSGKRPAKS